MYEARRQNDGSNGFFTWLELIGADPDLSPGSGRLTFIS